MRRTPVDYDSLLAELTRQLQAEVNADKLEISLWSLVRGTERAEARTRRHPRGIELLILVDGEMSTSTAYAPGDVSLMEATSAALRRAFEADGWVEAGPHAVP